MTAAIVAVMTVAADTAFRVMLVKIVQTKKAIALKENDLSWFEFLCKKYVQRSDDRQMSLGLQYTTAETYDLAEVIEAEASHREQMKTRKGHTEFLAAMEEQGDDVPTFVEYNEQEIYELFETGSATFTYNGSEFTISLNITREV